MCAGRAGRFGLLGSQVLPRLLFAAAILAACLGLVELSLRCCISNAPRLELDLYRFDESGNLALKPSIRRRHVSPFWDVTIETNSWGRRDHDRPAPEGKVAILGLGDSFAFGWGVELEQSFCSLLERELSENRPVRLVKAAVPGTGTSDQYRLMGPLLTSLEPDVVLVNVFIGNDFVDVAHGGAEQFEVENGLLIRGSSQQRWPERLRRGLARRVLVLQALRALQFNLSRADETAIRPRSWDGWMREFAQVHLKRPTPRTEMAFRETIGILDQMASRCEAADSRLVLMLLPRSWQVYPGELNELMTALNISRADLDTDRPQRMLLEWGAERGIPVIDVLPQFREAARGASRARLYFTPDSHMTPAAHEIVARTAFAPLAALID